MAAVEVRNRYLNKLATYKYLINTTNHRLAMAVSSQQYNNLHLHVSYIICIHKHNMQ